MQIFELAAGLCVCVSLSFQTGTAHGQALNHPPDPGRRAVAGAQNPVQECTVRGRVIDMAHKGIADASVILVAVGEPWSSTAVPPQVEWGGGRMEAYQATTDQTGAFQLVVPLPSAERVSLWIETPLYYELAGMDLDQNRPANEPRLKVGDNALGDFVVEPAGAVYGRVVDPAGTGIPGALVELVGEYSGGFHVNTFADQQGRFELGHVPPGLRVFEAKSAGYTSASSEAVTVTAKATAPSPLEFRLERAPAFAGLVVDESGRPVANALVHAHMVGRCMTRADGSFQLTAGQSGRAVEVDVQAEGFQIWRSSSKLGGPMQMGGPAQRIVLEFLAEYEFLVLDDRTRNAIEHFTLRVKEADRVRPTRLRTATVGAGQHHPAGFIRMRVDPHGQVVCVEAKGYAPLEVPVATDEGAPARQTLRMVPGAVLTGCIVLGGQRVAGVRLRLEQAEEQSERVLEFHDLVTQEDGSFRFEDLAQGTYQLACWDGGVAHLRRQGLGLTSGAVHDLGELHAERGSRVQGRVFLKAGQSPVGLELQLGRHSVHRVRIDNLDGRFAFEGVEPGLQMVSLLEDHDFVARSVTYSLEVGRGTQHDIDFDLRRADEPDELPVAERHCSFGMQVAAPGDVDQDGVPDLLVADPENDLGARYWLVSSTKHASIGPGRSHVLRKGSQESSPKFLSAPDVDGDGRPEFVLASIGPGQPASAAVSMRSGATDQELWRLDMPARFAEPGDWLRFVGDHDADGLADLAVLSMREGGAARVLTIYSSRTANAIWQVNVEVPAGMTACGVVQTSDLGPGLEPGMAVLLNGRKPTPTIVRCYSVATRLVVWEQQFSERFSSTMGRLELLKGAGNSNRLAVALYDQVILIDAAQGQVLHRLIRSGPDDEEQGFGHALAVLGDIDNDGMDDLALSVTEAWYGSVAAYSGQTAKRLWYSSGQLPGDTWRLGYDLAALGDVSGDGVCDLVAGTWGCKASAPGRAFLVDGRTGAVTREYQLRGDEVRQTWPIPYQPR